MAEENFKKVAKDFQGLPPWFQWLSSLAALYLALLFTNLISRLLKSPICYNGSMFTWFAKKTPENKAKNEVVRVAEKQLKEKRAIIESLRDYDTGKKTISTTNVERRMRDIRALV